MVAVNCISLAHAGIRKILLGAVAAISCSLSLSLVSLFWTACDKFRVAVHDTQAALKDSAGRIFAMIAGARVNAFVSR